ncbi:uncharacterized protein LOC113763561 [Coffea eugenioides]|uniref:uncharacterized protein LOC113760564 n=1 Tax=Coffea eugenioides TaxID=49369 RepID=UPI000F60C41D|nr:uncharacterized protein LOC113760564 [Coffea eugenioides]XP_027158995.1 uncharacterized protein LOC113760564 [Coffea eugenioides]XP_027163197.1 uncharacterized protein LOC113763561 [Coffea eugenioides]XP_027163198.1 uncharacterized protein LOC113763561 [Coffea eugenioides]
MGDSLRASNSDRILEARRAICSKKQSITHSAFAASKVLSQKALKCITSVKQQIQGSGVAGDIMVFLVTTAALEVVRRFSKAKCPFVWRALQALQILCYPPFKWLQRWQPFKGLGKHSKKLSRPMLVLSISTLFSDQPGYSTESLNDSNEIQDASSQMPRPDTSSSAEWLLELRRELRKHGMEVPERLGDDELHRYYAAVNGDFSKLVSSVKKTIDWRQSYKLFPPHELEAFSHLVFWHGHDSERRPCLIIRLGLACSNLQSDDRPLFIKAVVSQIEHGVLNLVTVDQPQIMVLMDCEGLSPFGFPIHMMRSCATLLQDHYPNRLGSLIIIRLPQLARVITQALFQVLKPATQRKVRTVGGNYQEILCQCLRPVPSFLGGNCSCSRCSDPRRVQDRDEDSALMPPEAELVANNSLHMHLPASTDTTEDRKQLKRTVIMVLLMLLMLILVILEKLYPEKLSLLYQQMTK